MTSLSSEIYRRSVVMNAVGLTMLCFTVLPAVAQESLHGLPNATRQDATLNSSSLDSIDAIVENGIRDAQMPGAVVLIGHQNTIAFHRAYGNRSLMPTSVAMTKDTLFDLASLTKPIATATSIMHLIEAGSLSLDGLVSDHVPEFLAGKEHKVTVQQLLLHTGGLIPDNATSDYTDGAIVARRKLLQLDLQHPPGSRFRYSDVGFQILGELIESVTGKSVAEYSSEHLFEPLGMKQTGYLPDESLRTRAAPTQQRDGRWMVGEVHDPRAFAMGGIAGHAGLFGTAEDLAIFAQMMLDGGIRHSTRILSPETVALMTAAYEVPSAQRGLGWDKRSDYSSNRGSSMSDSAYGHGGFTGTSIWIDPERRLYVIFLSNRVHPDGKGNVNPIAGAIGKIAADATIAQNIQTPFKLKDASGTLKPRSN